MKRLSLRLTAFVLALFLAIPCVCEADDNLSDPESDVNLKALEDELTRSIERLRLPPHDPPYFVEYSLIELDDCSISCALGSILSRSRRRGRNFYPVVRVGSYKMDDMNFLSSVNSGNSPDDFAPVDDDYFALRRALWLMTDYGYKCALEGFEEKKAFLLEKNTTEELDDFSRQPPLIWLKPVKRLSLDENHYLNETKKLSSVFRDYPHLFDSSVDFFSRVRNVWQANNEGSRIRYSYEHSRYVLYACMKTKEGMSVSDWDLILVHDRNDFPTIAQLEKRARDLAKRVTDVAQAPLIEDYEGPVIFEGDAAAEFFAQGLAPNMVATRPKINDSSITSFLINPFVKKLGKRIFPPFISVVDDPLTERVQGVDIFGGYEVDEEGVKAQVVKLVENGVLKALCSGRTPTKEMKESNGHGASGDRIPVTSCLYIKSTNQLKKKALYDQLKKLGREAGLDCVYVVRRLVNSSRYDMHNNDAFSAVPLSSPGSISLSNPLQIYKISLTDGKETLVRGARFLPANLRLLKDIVATGNDTAPHLTEANYSDTVHIITPSILIRSMEIERVDFNQIKNPVLENPLLETIAK
jgi:hypothetical protein